MNVLFNCNLDWYRGVSFPVLENIIPQVGNFVMVHPSSEGYCHANKIPIKLKVVGVYIHFDKIVCDLWYDDFFFKMASEKDRMRLLKQ